MTRILNAEDFISEKLNIKPVTKDRLKTSNVEQELWDFANRQICEWMEKNVDIIKGRDDVSDAIEIADVEEFDDCHCPLGIIVHINRLIDPLYDSDFEGGHITSEKEAILDNMGLPIKGDKLTFGKCLVDELSQSTKYDFNSEQSDDDGVLYYNTGSSYEEIFVCNSKTGLCGSDKTDGLCLIFVDRSFEKENISPSEYRDKVIEYYTEITEGIREFIQNEILYKLL